MKRDLAGKTMCVLGCAAIAAVALGWTADARAHQTKMPGHVLASMYISGLPDQCQALHRQDDPTSDYKVIPCAVRQIKQQCQSFIATLPTSWECPAAGALLKQAEAHAKRCASAGGDQLHVYRSAYIQAKTAVSRSTRACMKEVRKRTEKWQGTYRDNEEKEEKRQLDELPKKNAQLRADLEQRLASLDPKAQKARECGYDARGLPANSAGQCTKGTTLGSLQQEKNCLENLISKAKDRDADIDVIVKQAPGSRSKWLKCKAAGLLGSIVDSGVRAVCGKFPKTCAAIREGHSCLDAAKRAKRNAVAKFPALGRLLRFRWTLNEIKEIALSTWRGIRSAAVACGKWLKDVATTVVTEVGEKVKKAVCQTSLGRALCPLIGAAANCYWTALTLPGKVPASILSGLSRYKGGLKSVTRAILRAARGSLRQTVRACERALGQAKTTGEKVRDWAAEVKRAAEKLKRFLRRCAVSGAGACVQNYAWRWLNSEVKPGVQKTVELKTAEAATLRGLTGLRERSITATVKKAGNGFEVSVGGGRRLEAGSAAGGESVTGGRSGGRKYTALLTQRGDVLKFGGLFVRMGAEAALKAFVFRLLTIPPMPDIAKKQLRRFVDWPLTALARAVLKLFRYDVSSYLVQLMRNGILQSVEFEGCLRATGSGGGGGVEVVGGLEGGAKKGVAGCLTTTVERGKISVAVALQLGREAGLGRALGKILKREVKLAGGIAATGKMTVDCEDVLGKATSQASLAWAIRKCLGSRGRGYTLELELSANGAAERGWALGGGAYGKVDQVVFKATASQRSGASRTLSSALRDIKAAFKRGGWGRSGTFTVDLVKGRKLAYEHGNDQGTFKVGGEVGVSDTCLGYCNGKFDVDAMLGGRAAIFGSCRSTCTEPGAKRGPPAGAPPPGATPPTGRRPCPRGTELVAALGDCRPKCLRGQVRDRTGNCVCPAGTERYKGKCRQKCARGQIRNFFGKCVYRCIRGQVLHINKCVSRCPSGWVQDHWRCVSRGRIQPQAQYPSRQPVRGRCSRGYVPLRGRCVREGGSRRRLTCRKGLVYRSPGQCDCPTSRAAQWRPLKHRGRYGWQCRFQSGSRSAPMPSTTRPTSGSKSPRLQWIRPKPGGRRTPPRRIRPIPGKKRPKPRWKGPAARDASEGPGHYIAHDGVDLRVAPGSATAATLKRCQAVRILRTGVRKWGTMWTMVSAGGKSGFVQASQVKHGLCR